MTTNATPLTEAEIEAIMRRNVKADATGLAPAVISHYLFGFEDAAREISDAVAALTGHGEYTPITVTAATSIRPQPEPTVPVSAMRRMLDRWESDISNAPNFIDGDGENPVRQAMEKFAQELRGLLPEPPTSADQLPLLPSAPAREGGV